MKRFFVGALWVGILPGSIGWVNAQLITSLETFGQAPSVFSLTTSFDDTGTGQTYLGEFGDSGTKQSKVGDLTNPQIITLVAIPEPSAPWVVGLYAGAALGAVRWLRRSRR